MSSMSGYMLMTGQPLQDIRKQRKQEKEQAAKATPERPVAGRKAMMLGVDTGDGVLDRPFIGRSGTSSTKTSTDSDETITKKERSFNIFGHRKKKRSKDLGRPSEISSPISRFEIPGLRSASPVFGFRSTSPAPPELRAISPVPSGFRIASPIPPSPTKLTPVEAERISIESSPSSNSSQAFLIDIPEPKTNLSASDILFGGRQNIPPPPPPKHHLPPMIPNPKEDPIMSSLSSATVVKPKTPVPVPKSPLGSPVIPLPSSSTRTRPPPLRNLSASTSASPTSERPILPMPSSSREIAEQDHSRKASQSSDLDPDGIQDKKRQHWLCPESPHRNIINEKLYNELPLDISEMPVEPVPSAPSAPSEKDPSMFAPRPEDNGELPPDLPPPPPFEEEEDHNPEFSEDLKSHLRPSELSGEWWRLYAPPPELSYIPQNTPIEILNLYNDEQLEFDIKRIQSKAPLQPQLDVSSDSKPKRKEAEDGCVEEVGYNSHRASTHTAEGTIFSRRSIATTATSVSEAGVPENLSPVSPAAAPVQPPTMARWTAFSRWGPSNHDSLPAYSPMRESFLNGQWSPRKNDTGCAMCMEDLSLRRMIAIDCNHKYCNACLRSIILASLNDEISFPPKCCTARIPVKAVKTVCNLSEQAALNHKIREYSQAPQERVYCPRQSCGRYVPPESVKDFRTKCLVCQFCQTKVCPTCRGIAHLDGAPCPKDHSNSCHTCNMTKDACLCKTDEEKILEWGKTRFYESTHSDDFERRIDELHVQSAVADVVAYERKTIQEQQAAEEALRVRRDKEKMEQKRKEEARMTDISRKYDKLTGQLEMLLDAQSALMESRLAGVRAELLGRHEEGEARHEMMLAEEDETLEARVSERSVDLREKLDAELTLLDAKFEEEEDDIIIVLTRQHRGKPNRDERIKSAVDRLKHHQDEEKEEVKNKYSADFAAVRSTVLEDIELAKQDIIRHRELELSGQFQEWHEAARREYADEKWFEAVKEIRKEHLAIQFEAQKDEYRMKKLELELEESFKLAMMLELEDERDRVYSSARHRDTPAVKPLTIRSI
ncbi:hypothetical protein ABW19_dt0210211 [Dactylella cylindrospora]|nr:hypothetical protein ABW19_dt0210211 [Dactylella cylindrospora]